MIIFSKPTLVFILLMICSIAKAQTNEKEDIKIAKKDSVLLEHARSFMKAENQDREKAFSISHEVLKRTKSESNTVLAHYVLANYHYYKYATDSSLVYAKKAIGLIEGKEDSVSLNRLSYFYLLLSNASRDKNLIEESKKWALKGIEIVQKTKDSDTKDKLVISLAMNYKLNGDYTKSLELLTSTVVDKEDPNYCEGVALCYMELGNYEKALFYHKKALKRRKTIGNNRNIAVTLLNIGVVYLNMYEDDKAFIYFNKSLPIAREYNYPLIILNNILNICEIYREKKDFRNAKKGYNEVLEIAKKSGYLKQQLYVYQSLKNIALEEKKLQRSFREYREKDSNTRFYKKTTKR
ncbi:lipopolysaccharide assembly protein LapB [Aquimarina sp. EL_43]|uniref:tetratricopeptide repeat protein n=1 Tax=Aquimarina sp. EL_43 TaxID=2787736 RepID=UPI0020C46D49|nr:tetratricopeptide repeat protein [Aquimarina sp. EL_43]